MGKEKESFIVQDKNITRREGWSRYDLYTYILKTN